MHAACWAEGDLRDWERSFVRAEAIQSRRRNLLEITEDVGDGDEGQASTKSSRALARRLQGPRAPAPQPHRDFCDRSFLPQNSLAQRGGSVILGPANRYAFALPYYHICFDIGR